MKKRDILVSSLGNTIEWYDFGLFIFMAPVIGSQFFPGDSPAMQTIDAFIVFAAGFLCRPLGGIVFGYFGDKYGRARTLRISVLLITVATVLVGTLPGYSEIGILAPLMFIILRLLQGLSVGGEYSGVMIYLAEASPKPRRGFFTSFAATGANLGFLLATLSVFLLNTWFDAGTVLHWAWRLPFLFIGVPGFLLVWWRFRLAETQVYNRMQREHCIQAVPLVSAFRYAPRPLILIFGLTCMSASFYYVFFGYMPTYLEQYIGLSRNMSLVLPGIFLALLLFLVPIAGWCGDRITRRTMLACTAFGIIGLAVPCFLLLQTQSVFLIVTGLGIATVISACDQGNSLTAVVENCPPNVRYSGIAFSYNAGMAIFGGTTPLMVSLLTGRAGPLAPAWFLMGMATISLLAIRGLQKQNLELAPVHCELPDTPGHYRH